MRVTALTDGTSPLRFPVTVTRQLAVTCGLSRLVAVTLAVPGIFGVMRAEFPLPVTVSTDVSLLDQSTRNVGSETTVPSSMRLKTSALIVLSVNGGSMVMMFSSSLMLRTLSAFVTAFVTLM